MRTRRPAGSLVTATPQVAFATGDVRTLVKARPPSALLRLKTLMALEWYPGAYRKLPSGLIDTSVGPLRVFRPSTPCLAMDRKVNRPSAPREKTAISLSVKAAT